MFTVIQYGTDKFALVITPKFNEPDTVDDALELSIKKWEFIVEWLKTNRGMRLLDGGSHTCALCSMFLEADNCDECPVADMTGRTHCNRTPYLGYFSATISQDYDGQLRTAKAEFEFLTSIRKSMRGEV